MEHCKMTEQLISTKYKVYETRNRIFFANFNSQYDLAMHFLRYQEFYESPFIHFKGKTWHIVDFMDHYRIKHKLDYFSYPEDWGGFNIPSYVFEKVWKLGIPDPNRYDEEMTKIYEYCKSQAKGQSFYLIGAVGKGGAFPHEMAHGFFYTNLKYRRKMQKLVENLNPEFKETFFRYLQKHYHKYVWVDEAQAYLSTGMPEGFDIPTNGAEIPFKKVFKEAYKKGRV